MPTLPSFTLWSRPFLSSGCQSQLRPLGSDLRPGGSVRERGRGRPGRAVLETWSGFRALAVLMAPVSTLFSCPLPLSLEGRLQRSRIVISLVVQWLKLYAFTTGAVGSIPGQTTKIPHVVKHDQSINQSINE